MKKIAQTNDGQELTQVIEIERIKLVSSVNAEIAVAMKMADSPLIKRHFLHPEEGDLKRIAFDEIEGYRKAFKSNTVFWASDINKEFYFAEDNHYTINPEDPDNYWYKMTLYETEKYNFNINYNPEIRKIMLWINAPVFDNSGKPLGLVGTGIDLTEFVNSIYRGYKGAGKLYFFNTLGEITGAQNADLVTNKVTMANELGETGALIFTRAKDLAPHHTISLQTSDGTVAISPVPELGWFITAIHPVSLSSILNNGMTVLFIAMMAIIMLIFVIFYFFISGLLKPLNLMVATLTQISEDWDITRRLTIKQKDETGTLAAFFNLTFERMSEMIKDIKVKASSLVDTGKELNHTMGDTSQAVNKIDTNIQTMRGLVITQSEEVNSATAATGRIITGLENLNNHIAIQADSVAQSSSAIEQMLANISSVTNTLVKNSSNINSLAGSSEAGKTDLEKVSHDIQEIARDSEGLLEINSVMQNIASQTNLLSMNAAIEAAHAGESGRGFAVVADEIRKLAENSGKQSKTISAVLKKIKNSIDTITKSTSVVLERFGTIEEEVNTVSNQESMIRNAMEEQETGSRHILEAVTRLNTITGEVKNASSDMMEISNAVLKQNTTLKEISGNVAAGMDDMTERADMINNAITKVYKISQENQESIGSLNADIALFKV